MKLFEPAIAAAEKLITKLVLASPVKISVSPNSQFVRKARLKFYRQLLGCLSRWRPLWQCIRQVRTFQALHRCLP